MMENKIEIDETKLGKVIQKCGLITNKSEDPDDICPNHAKWACAGCEHYSEEWNVPAYINGLKWILQDDKFGFGTDWPKGSKPKDDVENAGYIVARVIEYLEGLVG